MFHKILVAIDGSEISNQAIEEAVAVAKAINGQLILVHVLSPFDEAYPSQIFPNIDGIYSGIHGEASKVYARQWHTYEEEGLELLRSWAAIAHDAGLTVEFSQNVGNPGRTICALASTWGADVIVMGRRGLSGLSEFFMGSVSNYVLHHAPCSVLTVQSPRSAKLNSPEGQEAELVS